MENRAKVRYEYVLSSQHLIQLCIIDSMMQYHERVLHALFLNRHVYNRHSSTLAPSIMLERL